MTTYTATATDAAKRLDLYLHEQLPDLTRSQIQKRIKLGLVSVNGKSPAVHQFLKAGDVISMIDTMPDAPMVLPNTTRAKTLPEIPVLADTNEYVVINKPAGVLVHPAAVTDEPTLVDWFVQHNPKSAKVGEDPMRPGIVHRLDRDVSGLMVIAKTQNTFDLLKEQFKSHTIEKWYYALVIGHPQKNEGEIRFNIDRSTRAGHKMAAVPEHEARGRRAITRFEVVERLPGHSLLKLDILTGRTHQIRVHLNAFNLPIVGDQLYRHPKAKTTLKTNRICLQAYHLVFTDQSDKRLTFDLPLDPTIGAICDKLRRG